VLEQALTRLGRDARTTTVAIQGYGNVGENAASLLSERGYPVVAASDAHGGIYDPGGLDIPALSAHKRKTGRLLGFPGGREITNAELLTCDCDVLIPAALSNQLDENNADRVRARIVLELANAPTTAEADDIFFRRDVLVIPDILANAGGVVVSYFEWSQNLSNDRWPEQKVLEKLKDLMTTAYNDVHELCTGAQCRMRKAAYRLGVKRILDAERLRGNL
jgi:glutamate dehydrogenase/leucine dehydrogenase